MSEYYAVFPQPPGVVSLGDKCYLPSRLFPQARRFFQYTSLSPSALALATRPATEIAFRSALDWNLQKGSQIPIIRIANQSSIEAAEMLIVLMSVNNLSLQSKSSCRDNKDLAFSRRVSGSTLVKREAIA